MKNLVLALTSLICTATLPGTAHAGPNFGGTLIVALSEGAIYSDDTDYCDEVTTPDCESAVARVDGAGDVSSAAVINVLAAFSPPGGRLTGLVWGIEYDPEVTIIGHRMCGDFEFPEPDWPASGSGTAVTFFNVQTDRIVPVYFFAAYADEAGPATLRLTLHPTQGGLFADDSIPAVIDYIAGFGIFGFGVDGTVPCPADGPIGACCFRDGHCEVTLEVVCELNDGTYQGDDTGCDPNPCPPPGIGACCFFDGSCIVSTESVCVDQYGGVYQGDDTDCEPIPCPGACCFADKSCLELSEEECAAQGGQFNVGQSCLPNPCDAPTGACCYADGSCVITTPDECEGDYQGEDAPCEPNPCPQPIRGACCFEDASCLELEPALCDEQGGQYMGDHTRCDPGLCEELLPGACCVGSHECLILIQPECVAQDGVWHGEESVCEPELCERSFPTACCFVDGTCTMYDPATCGLLGGEWQGYDSVCEPNPCPQGVGACCLPDGECQIMTQAECDAENGVYYPGIDCPGACGATPYRDSSWGEIKNLFR